MSKSCAKCGARMEAGFLLEERDGSMKGVTEWVEGAVGYHDFEGITVRPEEGERLIRNIGNKRVLMLRNHGPVVMAETLPAMFLNYYMLQRACEIQVKTSALGKPIRVAPEVVEVHQRDRDKMLTADFGKLDFEAWKRKLDTVDRGWRE